jgi:multidrug resistance efflux pump
MSSSAKSGGTAADHPGRLLPAATLECVMHGCRLMAAVMLALFVAYATAGQRGLTLLNTGSFWVDGYFEEDQLGRIHIGDEALVTLMGFRQPLEGHVASVASGVEVANAQSGPTGLVAVNPVYTWIRLAQRVPVRIEIDHVPSGVTLVAGQTATVQIKSGTRTRGE